MHTDEVTDRSISFGGILFKIALDVIKPQLVIDHWYKYIELKDLILEACQNNVRTYLKTMQENNIEVDTIRKDIMTYDMQWMNTRIFDDISKTVCKNFLPDMKQKKNEWIKDPDTFSTAYIMADLTNLCTNYKSTGIWDVQRNNSKSKIIALATNLKKDRTNNSTHKKPQGTTSCKPNGLAKWRFRKTGKDKSDPEGNKFVWFKKQGCKDRNVVQSGMYITAHHDHEDWQEIKTSGNTTWK